MLKSLSWQKYFVDAEPERTVYLGFVNRFRRQYVRGDS